MTRKEVKARVELIRQVGEGDRDNGTAHVLEGQLYKEVLQAITQKSRNPIGLAFEALKAAEIKFSRWVA